MRRKPDFRGIVERFMTTRGQNITVYNNWNTPQSSSFEVRSYKSSKPGSDRKHFVFRERLEVNQSSVLQIIGTQDLWCVTEIEDCVIRGEYIKFEAFVEKMPAQGTTVIMSTEQQLVKVLAAIKQLGGSNFTSDTDVAQHLGWELEHVQDYMDILAQKGWTQAANSFAHRCSALTAHGRTVLRDPEYASSKESSTVINVTGNQGVIVNANSILKDVTQAIDSSSHFPQDSKDDLKSLIIQLNEALDKVSSEHSESSEAIAETAKSLVEASDKDVPNKTLMKISAEGLQQAAKNIATVAPAVANVVNEIIATVSRR